MQDHDDLAGAIQEAYSYSPRRPDLASILARGARRARRRTMVRRSAPLVVALLTLVAIVAFVGRGGRSVERVAIQTSQSSAVKGDSVGASSTTTGRPPVPQFHAGTPAAKQFATEAASSYRSILAGYSVSATYEAYSEGQSTPHHLQATFTNAQGQTINISFSSAESLTTSDVAAGGGKMLDSALLPSGYRAAEFRRHDGSYGIGVARSTSYGLAYIRLEASSGTQLAIAAQSTGRATPSLISAETDLLNSVTK